MLALHQVKLLGVALLLVLVASCRGFNPVALGTSSCERRTLHSLRRDNNNGKKCTSRASYFRSRMSNLDNDAEGSNTDNNNNNIRMREELNQRIEEVRRDILKAQVDKPPHPKLGAVEFVQAVMAALREVDDPLPDFGCIVLLRSSTARWKREIHSSIGAPTWVDEAKVASVLNQALGRKNNQFGILVGGAEGQEGEEYTLQFPSEAVEDLDEGKCWVECRLRDPLEGTLLAVMGWDLKQRKHDGAWLIDRLDWQDFRDNYRPGIGRDEWIRVFG